MSDMNNDFEQMLEASLVTIHNGEIVEGTVIDVKEDEIVLNIGYKADGIITRNEYSNQSGIDLRDVVKDRKSTRLNSSHPLSSRMPSSA